MIRKNLQTRAFSFRFAALAALSLSLVGCATDMSRYYDVQAKAVEADNNAVMGLAAAAATGNQGAIMALALRQGSAGKIAPPQDKALVWASVLVPAFGNLMQGYWGKQVSIKNIESDAEKYGLTIGAIRGVSETAINKEPVIVGPSEGFGVMYPREPVPVAAPVAEPAAPAQ